jgi:DNA integrity scanning protein DisA with diadenylate cyclase activity
LLRSISSRALAFGRTLKPTIGAPLACASMTSLSVIAPTPELRMRTLISSVEIRLSALTIASVDPCTSAFTTSGYSITVFFAASAENMFSMLDGAVVVRLAVAFS